MSQTLRKFWKRGSLGTLNLAVSRPSPPPLPPVPGPRDRGLACCRPRTTCSTRSPAGLRESEAERGPSALLIYRGYF